MSSIPTRNGSTEAEATQAETGEFSVWNPSYSWLSESDRHKCNGGFPVAAALGFHRDLADQNAMVHFLKNISIKGGLFQIAAFGAGRFSIDSRLTRSDSN